MAASQPAIVATTPGTQAPAGFSFTGATGGDTSIATTGVGGIGAAFSITGGTGGVAASAVTASTGGKGGTLTYTGGTGGAANAAANIGTNVGGAGGDFVVSGGTGGNAANGTDTGGAGGHVYIVGGAGGTGDSAGADGTVYIGLTSAGAARGTVVLGSAMAVNDDVRFTLGTGGDIVLVNRSTILNANATLASVMIGTPVTPAVAADSLILSNITQSGDILIAANNGGNSQAWLWVDSSAATMTLYASGVEQLRTAVGALVINEPSADVDFRVESNNMAYAIYSDGGKDALVLGSNTDTSSTDQLITVSRAARTATANTDYFDLAMAPAGAVTVPAGTTAVVAEVSIAEPNVTATGTVTRAATLYIASQPTEGSTSNAAILFGSAANIACTTSLTFNEDSEDINFRFETNGMAYAIYSDGGKDALVLGSNTDTSSVDQLITVSRAARTATANINYYDFAIQPAGAVTIPAGTTAVVASVALNEPNVTATGTVTAAATLYIASQPTEGTSNAALGLADDLWIGLGSDNDQVIAGRASAVNANTLVAGLSVGTPVVTAIPANSLVTSNVTANGDMVWLLNDTSGNSWEYARFDGSAKLIVFNEASSDIDFRIESNGNANMFTLDGALDAIGIGGAAVSGNTLTVTNGSLGATGRIAKLSATLAGAALTDGYGAFEVDVTLSDSPTDHSAAASAWVNITGGTVPAGTYICARNDGVYEASAATITNAKIVFGARMHKLLDDADALSFPFSINTNNTAITAVFDTNNFSDIGYVANAGAAINFLVPFMRDAAGTLKYVKLYDLA